MNSIIPESPEEKVVLTSGVSKDFLNDKRDKDQKVVLGKGAFGKVRLALSIFENQIVDIEQLICVKKSLHIGKKINNKTPPITQASITDSQRLLHNTNERLNPISKFLGYDYNNK